MMKILKKFLARLAYPKIVVVDNKPLATDEYVFAFLVDVNNGFFKALMQLIGQMKADALDACNQPKSSDRDRLDALARYGALEDLRATIYFQIDNAVKERDRRNTPKSN